MQAADFKGLYAMMPSPALPGSDAFGATKTVNIDETARLTEQLIRDGVSGLVTTGTTGECATLSETDYRELVACIVETARGRVPVFVGATSMSAHQLAERLDYIHDLGATGTLLGLPMWQPLTTHAAIAHYRDASEYRPELTIFVYPNVRAFRYGFEEDFWIGLSREVPKATAAKFNRKDKLASFLKATDRKINFMPIDMFLKDFHEISPETTTACWTTAAAMNPKPSLVATESLSAGDISKLAQITEKLAWSHEPIDYIVRNPEHFGKVNIQVEKLRIAASGYCDPGPIRPPYNYLSEEDRAAVDECARRWKELVASIGEDH